MTTTLPPAGYEYGEARRRYVEQYGSTLVMNTYLQVAVACLSAVIVGLVGLNVHTQRTFGHVKPLVIRIDDVGHAAAVSYDSLTYTPQAPELKVSRGEIVFDDVRFGYGRETGVLQGFRLTVKPGEKIGLVGRSGAGKSTAVNLLLRFFDVEEGRILIDAQDIASVTQESLRAQISVVTQDTSLLHRSIRENIRYGRPTASDAEVARAAELAHAEEFIAALEDWKGRHGYEAQVGERGVKLSGGQRQRIAIARVILKNAPILVLDEATSALDSESEAAIQERLNLVMEGKTVIAIAHRLSTIARMDRIVVLDHGRIVEEGRPDELVERDGLFARLWKRQTGGFIPEDIDEALPASPAT